MTEISLAFPMFGALQFEKIFNPISPSSRSIFMERAANLQNVVRVTKLEPLKGEDFDKFFVETDAARGQNAALSMSDYFLANIDEPKKVLFMGHRGSGKSTELYRFGKYIEHEFKVINFSIKEDADIRDLEYADMIFVILRRLYNEAIKDQIPVNEHVLDNLDHYWKNETLIENLKIDKANLETGAKVKGGFWDFISLHISGVLSTGSESKTVVREHIKPRLSQLITGANDFIRNITREYQKLGKALILVIEDLDKLDLAVAEELFLKRTNILTSFHLHTIYTFPIFLHYTPSFNEIGAAFDHYEMLSMMKVTIKDGVTPYTEGRKIIREIIEKRADLSLFDKDALDFIIEKSGGSLRHLFEMLQNAVLDVRVRNRTAAALDKKGVENAYQKLRNYFERTIASEHLDALKDVYNSADKKPMQNPKLKEMLNCMAVIEYNGVRWCNLHPAVEDILREKRIIGTNIAQP